MHLIQLGRVRQEESGWSMGGPLQAVCRGTGLSSEDFVSIHEYFGILGGSSYLVDHTYHLLFVARTGSTTVVKDRKCVVDANSIPWHLDHISPHRKPNAMCRTNIVRDGLDRLVSAVEPLAANVNVLVWRARKSKLGANNRVSIGIEDPFDGIADIGFRLCR